MDGILDICIVVGGILILLGIGGGVCDLAYRLPVLSRMFDKWFQSLPIGRGEVQLLGRTARWRKSLETFGTLAQKYQEKIRQMEEKI